MPQKSKKMWKCRVYSRFLHYVQTYDDYNCKYKIMWDIFPEIASFGQAMPETDDTVMSSTTFYKLTPRTKTVRLLRSAIELIDDTLYALNNVPMTSRLFLFMSYKIF